MATDHLDGERGSLDVVIGEFQIHDVVARFRGSVGNVQSAVLVVLTFDFSFARSLNRQRKSTVTCRSVHEINYQLGDLFLFFSICLEKSIYCPQFALKGQNWSSSWVFTRAKFRFILGFKVKICQYFG